MVVWFAHQLLAVRSAMDPLDGSGTRPTAEGFNVWRASNEVVHGGRTPFATSFVIIELFICHGGNLFFEYIGVGCGIDGA